MTGSTRIVGVLHTVPALAATFDTLIAKSLPGVRRQHIVDAWMLETAIAEGVTPEVEARVAAHLAHLEATGAEAVLVTCSSIGEAAERAAAGMRIRTTRRRAPSSARRNCASSAGCIARARRCWPAAKAGC